MKHLEQQGVSIKLLSFVLGLVFGIALCIDLYGLETRRNKEMFYRKNWNETKAVTSRIETAYGRQMVRRQSIHYSYSVLNPRYHSYSRTNEIIGEPPVWLDVGFEVNIYVNPNRHCESVVTFFSDDVNIGIGQWVRVAAIVMCFGISLRAGIEIRKEIASA